MSRVTLCHSAPWRPAPDRWREVVTFDTFQNEFCGLAALDLWLSEGSLWWKDLQLSCVWGGCSMGEENETGIRILPSWKQRQLLWEECIPGEEAVWCFFPARGFFCPTLTTACILHLPPFYFLRIHIIEIEIALEFTWNILERQSFLLIWELPLNKISLTLEMSPHFGGFFRPSWYLEWRLLLYVEDMLPVISDFRCVSGRMLPFLLSFHI